jgi:hypothetical protein
MWNKIKFSIYCWTHRICTRHLRIKTMNECTMCDLEYGINESKRLALRYQKRIAKATQLKDKTR